ncbi:MAG: M48 family metallopeptidase [Treponemataceae bacterium]|nr:M48 family metallopeptidase [Treponemataceae bacterium]
MKTKILFFILVITFLFLFVSCASTSNTISFDYTPQDKYEIGTEVAANILGTYKLYYNENLYTYLNSICSALAIHADNVNPYKGYSIGVLDTNIINAFATPGGHILISRGMLKSANSEDELAAIIAHEISHIQLEHSIKAIKKNTRTQTLGAIATTTFAIMAYQQGESSDKINDIMQNGALLTNFSTELVNSGYSKNSEFDADEMAIFLMNKTGYNPKGMIGSLETLKNNKSKNYLLGFGKTHPTPKKRLQKANKIVKNINKQIKNKNEYNEESRVNRFENIKQYF